MSWLWVLVALSLISSAIALRRQTGLPWKRIAYSDTLGWHRAEHPLIAHRHGLVGKPDYLFEKGRQLIPVEVKPARLAPEPYPSDVMQLAAYCLLVEETSGVRPAYGLLRYRHTTFKIRFDDRLRNDLLRLIGEMRSRDRAIASTRSHHEARRCAACGFRTQCDETLV
jgi:CRISPR-associated exonuclease Cas4